MLNKSDKLVHLRPGRCTCATVQKSSYEKGIQCALEAELKELHSNLARDTKRWVAIRLCGDLRFHCHLGCWVSFSVVLFVVWLVLLLGLIFSSTAISWCRRNHSSNRWTMGILCATHLVRHKLSCDFQQFFCSLLSSLSCESWSGWMEKWWDWWRSGSGWWKDACRWKGGCG